MAPLSAATVSAGGGRATSKVPCRFGWLAADQRSQPPSLSGRDPGVATSMMPFQA